MDKENISSIINLNFFDFIFYELIFACKLGLIFEKVKVKMTPKIFPCIIKTTIEVLIKVAMKILNIVW